MVDSLQCAILIVHAQNALIRGASCCSECGQTEVGKLVWNRHASSDDDGGWSASGARRPVAR